MAARILIADDSAVVRTALRQLLTSVGPWEIFEAEDGKEAVEKAQELAPNLIILDLAMPVMDGLAAARELTKLLPEVPIVMHTLYWSPQVEVEALKAGARKAVPKSKSSSIVAVVQELLAAESPGSSATLAEPPASTAAGPRIPSPAPVLETSVAGQPDQPAVSSGNGPGNGGNGGGGS